MVNVGDKVSQGVKLLTLSPSGDGGGGATAQPADGPRPSSGTQAADSAESATQAEAESAQPASESAEAGPESAQPESESVQAESESAQPASSQPAATQPARSAPPAEGDGGGPVYASPAVRRIARELGVDLHQVNGSGRKGRITKEDVQSFASRGPGAAEAAPALGVDGGGLGLDLPPWPPVDFEKFGPIERVERSRIQRISGPNLARNWVMIPHVTHNDEADITDLEAWRKQLNEEHARDGVKVTMVSFLIVASVATLKAFPAFNASLDGEDLILKRYYNIGFAADTPGGLVVPVIKDTDQKGLLDIARELSELSGKAREGKLAPGDMQGASFTISSLGGIGGTSFTPIINAPEVAILGATRSAMKPVWNGREFEPRLMVPLSLSYDHRVIDGAAAARFVVHLVKVLSDLRRALL
jgi:pyruvate dehydrogenase E2 component (dihydrolipoamide acetyltransferase)